MGEDGRLALPGSTSITVTSAEHVSQVLESGRANKVNFRKKLRQLSLFLGDSLHSSKCFFQSISRRRQSHRERRQLHHWRIDDGTFEFGGPGRK